MPDFPILGFAAGTPLLVSATECKPIEAFRPGDVLLSRSEFDPEGTASISAGSLSHHCG